MSDYEGNNNPDDELSLPRATVYKLIGEMLPDDVTCAKETRDLLIDCCNVGIFGYSNQDLQLLLYLKDLGFEGYISGVKEAYSDHKTQQSKDKSKKSTKLEQLGLSQEELLKSQEALFAQARMRYEMNAKKTEHDQ
ncbi:Negative cofactor 2 complex subunit beta [Zancudomyces culisetae]|uniref:Negative cofactor 2 complex subunit beta n=1 Tax=Zancudomyces culisetae TaxID=1213189 RepID=A0A1R1PVG0_ZANCU|nr:Negative cofactor 2 complex subunit beta [Zancudomyces culisetae]OMH85660.1 Negative cofactor 2 complex subunit beta [Zancudomyces culisetae]|eukprot:OMH84943.1 Negative cofactor 2 complex subunit beta [Zancudomyces culisetae]